MKLENISGSIHRIRELKYVLVKQFRHYPWELEFGNNTKKWTKNDAGKLPKCAWTASNCFAFSDKKWTKSDGGKPTKCTWTTPNGFTFFLQKNGFNPNCYLLWLNHYKSRLFMDNWIYDDLTINFHKFFWVLLS